MSAYAWQQGNLRAEGVFDYNEEGQQSFAEYLGEHRGSQFSLLANVAEEGHALETIPFLQGADRRTLITRKIGQNFLGTPLATSVSLGYEKNQRKNEKLLLSALTNPAHFEPWLRRLSDAEVPLAGIYTVAQLGGQLLKKLGQENSRCLLLTLQDHSIRETYLVDGHAHFSRMAPLSDSSIAGIASAFAAEAGKLHQYQIGQRLIGRDESLPAFIVAHPLTIPAIEKACPAHNQLNFTFIDSHVAKFANRSEEKRNQIDQEYHWANIRQLAKKANVKLDRYLDKTIIISANQLEISLRLSDFFGEQVVELQPFIPGIDSQKWLNCFDAFIAVQNHYDLNTSDNERIRILLEPDAKAVLQEIKKMPKRRVSGIRAENFLRNPFALLGETMSKVISPESFERARDKAGLHLYDFESEVIRIDTGHIKSLKINLIDAVYI